MTPLAKALVPVFPFTVWLASSEGRDCVITLEADGGWKGDPDHLESALAEMAADDDGEPREKVILWLLLREMKRGP
jgi:hypothetical protein